MEDNRCKFSSCWSYCHRFSNCWWNSYHHSYRGYWCDDYCICIKDSAAKLKPILAGRMGIMS